MTPQSLAHVNGEIVPINEAKISLLDWGFLRSDATYDVAHVWDGHLFRLDEHLQRYFAGMKKLRMTIPYNETQLTALLVKLVGQSGLRNAYVEMITTRGVPESGSLDPRTCKKPVFRFCSALCLD